MLLYRNCEDPVNKVEELRTHYGKNQRKFSPTTQHTTCLVQAIFDIPSKNISKSRTGLTHYFFTTT